MLSRWFPVGSNPAFWRVAFALLLSLLFHIILLGFVHIDLSIFEPEKEVIEVRFASLVKTPLPEPVQEVAPAMKKSSLPEPPVAVEQPASIEPEQSLPVTPAVEPVTQEQLSPEVFAQENVAPQPEEFIPEMTQDTQPVPDAQPEPVINEVAADTQPLSFVETEFDILRGIDGTKIGQTKIHYQSRDDGTYVIESDSEAKGLASLFISGKLIQRSEGSVTENGLQPTSFLYQYDSSSKLQRASFDWENRRLTLETGKGTQTMRLPRDAQDLISFMYQFMFVPPLQEMQLNITNGKRLKAYGYSFVGEEDLSTKIGIVRAMHLENINDDGDEKNEIWLAVDSRFLPVKIRKTEKDGSVIEQVVTNIKTDILQ